VSEHFSSSNCHIGFKHPWKGSSEPLSRFGQEIVGFKWVYTFNDRKEKLIPGNFNLEGETPWIRRNLIEGDS